MCLREQAAVHPRGVMTEPLRIGYISSVYPRASDTFVRGEVSQLRKLGFEVIPFSVRRPEKGQLLTDEVLRESKQTTYLLGDAKFTLLTAFVSQSMRAPARKPFRRPRPGRTI